MKPEHDFPKILDLHFDKVYGYVAFRLAPDRHAAEDITQEVFLAAMKGIRGLRSNGSALMWLKSIARNKVADHFRAMNSDGARRQPDFDSRPIDADNQMADGQHRAALVSAAMRRIPSHYAELIEDKYLEGLSVKQIAEQRGMSEKAVQSALFRGRQAFRERFEQLLCSEESRT